MAKLSDFIVDGYLFTDRKQIEQANKEAEGVDYVRSRTNMDHPQSVLRIYRKMIEQEMFTTQVGISYLRELQDYLYSQSSIRPEDILPIPVAPPPPPKVEEEPLSVREKKAYKGKIASLIAVIITLAAVVVVMFVIQLTSGNATIINYENELIDKYSAWEQELNEREQYLKDQGKETLVQDGME